MEEKNVLLEEKNKLLEKKLKELEEELFQKQEQDQKPQVDSIEKKVEEEQEKKIEQKEMKKTENNKSEYFIFATKAILPIPQLATMTEPSPGQGNDAVDAPGLSRSGSTGREKVTRANLLFPESLNSKTRLGRVPG